MTWLLGKVIGNPLLIVWIAIGAFLTGAVSGGGAAWTVQGWRLDAVKAEFKGFVDTTRIIGEVAKEQAAATAAVDKRKQEQANHENDRTLATLRADNKRLRNARAGGSFVPAAAPGAARPETACFGRPELERAIRNLDTEIQGLIDEGDEARINLDTARKWASPP